MHRGALKEIAELKYGMDFRDIKYRREVFLRFYEFHMKYQSHPGAVYYAFPYIFKKHKMSQEQKYWFCFINGLSQNVLTTYEIWSEFPDLGTTEPEKLMRFFRKNYKKFGWDTDRKWVKNNFEKAVASYVALLKGRTQEQYFHTLCSLDTPEENFQWVWNVVMNQFQYFGRLSTFSYLEYMKIAGLDIECDSLFLDDLEGSKSHRNGLCKVLGRDDLDWHDTFNPGFDGKTGYTPEILEWLKTEGNDLLNEARKRFNFYHEDIGYFTLESTLCCFKSWFRPNRRYPNVYNDMFHDRIKRHEEFWGESEKTKMFWAMRKECLPVELRLEDNPRDVGLKPLKQNHFRNTGQVIMMDKEYPEFRNSYNDYVNK